MSKSRSRLAADWFAKLRINAQTQEVEHTELIDTKTELETDRSTEISTLDSEKADTTYVNTQIATLDSEKADLSYVTNAINNIDLSVKADVTYVDNAVANATMADSDILAAVKRVDGSGSGLDADTLDGIQASSFLRSDTSDTMNSDLTFGSSANIHRSTHSSGFLVGSYNSVGSNATKSNPIYTIGSSYQPSDTDLSNMYGIGFTSGSDATFDGINNVLSGWGLYVAAGGYARIGLDGSTGKVTATSFAGDGSALTGIAAGLGVGQNWTSVSRSNNVTYTNSTGRPIFCMYTGNHSDMHQSYLYINGTNVAVYSNNAGYDRTVFSFIVPAGDTYRIYTRYSQSGFSKFYEIR